MLTQKDFDQLEEILVTKDELSRQLTDFKSDLINKLDKILKEILASRQEMKILTHKSVDHEDRIEKLEDIHPNGKHPGVTQILKLHINN